MISSFIRIPQRALRERTSTSRSQLETLTLSRKPSIPQWALRERPLATIMQLVRLLSRLATGLFALRERHH